MGLSPAIPALSQTPRQSFLAQHGLGTQFDEGHPTSATNSNRSVLVSPGAAAKAGFWPFSVYLSGNAGGGRSAVAPGDLPVPGINVSPQLPSDDDPTTNPLSADTFTELRETEHLKRGGTPKNERENRPAYNSRNTTEFKAGLRRRIDLDFYNRRSE